MSKYKDMWENAEKVDKKDIKLFDIKEPETNEKPSKREALDAILHYRR